MADESAHHISAAGLAALEAELHELETEGRRPIAEPINDDPDLPTEVRFSGMVRRSDKLWMSAVED